MKLTEGIHLVGSGSLGFDPQANSTGNVLRHPIDRCEIDALQLRRQLGRTLPPRHIHRQIGGKQRERDRAGSLEDRLAPLRGGALQLQRAIANLSA